MDVEKLEQEIAELKGTLKQKEDELALLKMKERDNLANGSANYLTKDEIVRYSRQIVLPEIRVRGQLLLKNCSVLIVGAGGLGCPSALYLAGAGVGHLGIVDYDEVELNNLHRQLLHAESAIGKPKVTSAASSLKKLNSGLRVTEHKLQLDSSNAFDVIQKYSIVVDASDNVATRYLLNDACVLAGRPLVSGSALRFEGQLTVYNYEGGPCYRCQFPTPPPPETVTNCGDGGVLGAVPGTIGLLQALEVIKITLKLPGVLSGRLLVFDTLDEDRPFRNVKLRNRNESCAVCGESGTINKLVDYEQFCGAKANDKDSSLSLLQACDRISALTYKKICDEGRSHILIDVRPQTEFEMCCLKNSINVPLDELAQEKNVMELKKLIEEKKTMNSKFPLFVVCRRGNNSQKGVLQLKNILADEHTDIQDIAGGLHAWAKHVDNNFPVY